MRAGENRNEGHLELLIWEFPIDWLAPLEFAAAGHGCNCLSWRKFLRSLRTFLLLPLWENSNNTCSVDAGTQTYISLYLRVLTAASGNVAGHHLTGVIYVKIYFRSATKLSVISASRGIYFQSPLVPRPRARLSHSRRESSHCTCEPRRSSAAALLDTADVVPALCVPDIFFPRLAPIDRRDVS